ncbi:MAG: 23S rRNA (guanosine(2251)-2'-O)-methyltransferase RlmB [Deltaproteobacteria bacterium]
MRIIYGVNPVAEALRSPSGAVERIIFSESRQVPSGLMDAAKKKGVEIKKVPRRELDRLAGTVSHQGVAAVVRGEFRYKDLEDLTTAWKESGQRAFFLILDSIQDPQNLGSLIRASDAAGVHGIIIPKDRACEVTPAVVKASAGATEHARIAREVNISRAMDRLKEDNVWVVGIEAGGARDIYSVDLDMDLAIVVGSEGRGIRRLVREKCDLCVSIPMAGRLNSLNAAQAGAIAMFEARRQRLEKPR